MKRLQSLILISLLFLSCDSLLGVRITEEQQFECLLKGLNKVITADMRVSEIMFTSTERKLTEVMESASITYSTDSTDKFRIMLVDLSSWKILEDKETKHKYKTATNSILDFDFSSVIYLIYKASTMIAEKDMEFAGIDSFTIKFISETEADYEFDIYGKSKTTQCDSKKIGGTRKSPKYRTYCYCSKVSFEVTNGELKMYREGGFEWVW